MLGHLSRAGYQICSDSVLSRNNPADYDIFIINTCCFIDSAEKESRDIISQAIEIREQGRKGNGYKIIVSGCLAQLYKEKLYNDFKGKIDGIIGLSERNRIVQLADELLDNPAGGLRGLYWNEPSEKCRTDTNRLQITPKYYAYLRIAEGCDNRCSYCIIPSIHGKYRSKPFTNVLDEARALAKNGVKEVNLIAQDTTSYGKDLTDKTSLSLLLREINEIKGIKWIRVLYTHPAHFTDELIETIRNTRKVVKYVDLPIQHISDNILSGRDGMRRQGTKEKIKRLIEKIRERIPSVFIRTTVIVGFPGETGKDFKELLDFIKEMEFERLGAFTYSQKAGTPACALDKQIPENIKQERLDEIMSLQQKIAFKKNNSLINETLEIIIDKVIPYNPQRDGDYAPIKIGVGRTYGDAPEVDGNVIIKGARLAAAPKGEPRQRRER
ncbi:MAG: 30S ribosomal protein S12 methylthiotransferase RimO, partial [Planctomycetota bacterium]|nr:30S ribosomal protein S12 methylthiotransferase RimO [Planctomycetota bacterium]